MEIDSTPLDLIVVYPDGTTGRPDLTVLFDLATRTISATMLRAVATKSVDVAAFLLAKALTPLPMQPGWDASMTFSRSILPPGTLLDDKDLADRIAARPIIQVTDRRKCVQCSGGHSVYGRFPRAGWVCLRHRRWLAGTQPRIDPPSPLLAAERQYRNHLASRHILFDGAAMRLGAECARVALSPADITARQEATGLPLEAVIYPEQVAFCRIATRPSLLSWAVHPDTEPADVRRVLDAECRRVVPDHGDSEPWRASTRLQTVLFALRADFRERLLSPERAWSGPDRWNLLRHVWEDAN